MQIVRRIYLYVMSGIALGVLLVGCQILLGVVFHTAGLGGGDRFSVIQPDREALSLSAALIVVGLLVWGGHWLLIERSLRADSPRRDEERGAAERALYLSVVLAVLLVFGVVAGVEILERAIARIVGVRLGGSFGGGADSGDRLATVVVTGLAWAYHVLIRQRDLRAGPLSGAGAWIPRVYLYGATLIGLIFTAYNIGNLLGAGSEAILGRTGGVGASSAARQAAIAIAGLLGWASVWLGHWWYATRLTVATGWRADSERRSRLRVAFFVVAIGSTALATAIFGFMAINGALGEAMGVSGEFGRPSPTTTIVVPLVSLLPWVAAWWLHRAWLFGEARAAEDGRQVATAERLLASVVGLIGLGALAAGVALLLGFLLEALLAGRQGGSFSDGEVAAAVALILVGLVFWPWNWRRLEARRMGAPLEEAGSTVRRAYLLVVVGLSVVAGLGSLAYLLYRLFASILGATSPGSGLEELAAPVGILIVAVAGAAYHGLALRRDQELRERVEPAAASAADWEPAPTAGGPQRRVLVLSGPAT
ncbi:MAG TPA: DUF5671 domain-containing protein, partial [Candidatus Limnocylindria bacterium]|nr:DUF5671 domain-containing protein [Candidatus Limnocylindria bacterium]